MNPRRLTVLGSIAALGVLPLAAPAAVSAASGVTIDPNTPAGREYAIPLQSTRHEFSGGHGGGSGSKPAASAPQGRSSAQQGSGLFGTGITPTTGKAESERASRHGAATGHSGHSRAHGRAAAPVTAAVRPAAEQTGSTVSATGLSAAIVAAVVLVAGATALVLRRLDRS